MPRFSDPRPPFSTERLPPGTRLGLLVSGGADSVALLRLAHALAPERGWVPRVLHVDHQLRGEASAGDAAFVEQLAARLGLPCEMMRAELLTHPSNLEQAGRFARYGWCKRLLAARELDAVATGHTLEDQAETVLANLLRGAWTGGLGGIHPVVPASDLPGEPDAGPGVSGFLVRPLLGARRDELRAWLTRQNQPWREDSTNIDPRFTRNRIRHELLPTLNAQAIEHLAQVSVLARDDEAYWQGEVQRVLPGLLLPGRAVRGGGRASSTLPGVQSIAIEVDRLWALVPALRRRVLRAAAGQLGALLDYAETARVLALLEGKAGSAPRREQLTGELRAERTPRELRFFRETSAGSSEAAAFPVPIPGEASGLGVHLRVRHISGESQPPARLRPARASDRVHLRHSSGAPKRVKEVLERLGVPPGNRACWPLLEWQGEIVSMRGAALAPTLLSEQLFIEWT